VSALQEVGPLEYDGTHIVFRIDDIGAKTNKWFVNAKNGDFLGRVRWFGRWRRYCFSPEYDCVFEEICLREIAQFVIERTEQHRTKRAQKSECAGLKESERSVDGNLSV
jgi:hypothetical protein